jgi:hypothetical protein
VMQRVGQTVAGGEQIGGRVRGRAGARAGDRPNARVPSVSVGTADIPIALPLPPFKFFSLSLSLPAFGSFSRFFLFPFFDYPVGR